MNTFYFRWFLKKLRNLSLLMLFISISSFSVAASQVHNRTTINTQKEYLDLNKELSIKELFTYISKRTNYQFFYNSDLKDLTTKVKIDVKKSSIEDLLNIAFKNTSLEYTVKGNNIAIRKRNSKKTESKTVRIQKSLQVSTIKGTVLDDTNMPLPGVSIIIKGTSNGTTTDFDGNYEIKAEKGDVLVFSYLGFENQSVTVGDTTTINITMKSSSNMLDEVIIAGVASGTSKKKMSVSVTKIKSDAINMVPQSSVSASLSGKIAGVTITSLSGSPGTSSSIQLRGATSLSGRSNPMIIIDGVITKRSLADINADDIESIEIVKGAAASALYGSDAANGVVVITSKRGKNLDEGKTSITFRTRIGMQEVAKFIDLAESHYYELAPDWLSVDTYTKYNGVIYPEGYISGADNNICGSRIDKEDGYMDLPYRVNNNLQEAMFTNGLSNTLYASVGHRSEKSNIFFSIEGYNNKGIVIETGGYKRKSLRFNFDHHFTDNLSFSASNNLIETNNNLMAGGGAAFFSVLMMEPDVDLFKPGTNGYKYVYYPNQWNQQYGNPLYNLWRTDSNSAKTRFMGSYNMKYAFTDWLNAKISYAFETEKYNRFYLVPVLTQEQSPKLTLTNKDAFNQTIKGILNFSKSWNDLDFKGKLSYLYENYNYERAHYEVIGEDPDDHYKEKVLAEDYYAIASFVYKDRYIFDALFRNDGSSLFGENERRHNYYRISGAYRVTKDIELPGIQELKLRAAYGTSGLRPGFLNQYEFFTLKDDRLFKAQLGNKDLKPARNIELEIGMDVSFLDRFYLETSYSNTKTEDSFVNVGLLAPIGGWSYQYQNVGTLEAKTFEAMLDTKLVKKDNFKWNLGVTFDRTRSKILNLDIPAFPRGPRSAFKMEDGGQYGLMYGRDFVHTLDQMAMQLPEGESIDEYSINRDGMVVRTEDIGTIREKAFILLDENNNPKEVVIGDVTPNFRMGFNTTISYKNLSFYTLWKWKNGGDIYNGTAQYLVRDLRHPMMDQMHTKPEEKKAVPYYQSLYDANSVNSFWVEDGSYVRLNEASLYYNINSTSKLLKDRFLENIKIGVTGKNLYTFTNYTGYDPEAGYSGFIFDNFGYPNFRTYSFSLDFKF